MCTHLSPHFTEEYVSPFPIYFTQVLTPMVSQGLLLVKKRKIQKSGFFF
jgi:hypothetical protein